MEGETVPLEEPWAFLQAQDDLVPVGCVTFESAKCVQGARGEQKSSPGAPASIDTMSKNPMFDIASVDLLGEGSLGERG